MYTRPPDVSDDDVIRVLADGWDIGAVGLEYRAVGFGSHHWRATSRAAAWFVTVDDLVAKRRDAQEPAGAARDRLLAALETVAVVNEAGYEFAVAPVRATDGRVAVELGDRYVVAVYAEVSGRTYDYGNYVDHSHRDEVVQHLAALHGAPPACRRRAMTETFDIPRRAELFEAIAHLADTWDGGPYAEPTRRLLADHAGAVVDAFGTYDALAAAARSRPDRFVLTHGEPHPANTITTEQGVVLVDWDTVLLGPPERDLWDMVGEHPGVADHYAALTGIAVDPDVIELYRRAWDLAEIAIYVTDLRRPHERTADVDESWTNLQQYLDPARW